MVDVCLAENFPPEFEGTGAVVCFNYKSNSAAKPFQYGFMMKGTVGSGANGY